MLWNNDSLKWVFIRMNRVNEWLFSSSCIPETYQQRRSRYIKKTLQISSYIALIGGSKIDCMDVMNSCSWLYLSWKKWNEEINIIFCFLITKEFLRFQIVFCLLCIYSKENSAKESYRNTFLYLVWTEILVVLSFHDFYYI